MKTEMIDESLRDLQKAVMNLREDIGELRGEMRGYMNMLSRLESEGARREQSIGDLKAWQNKVAGMAAAAGAIASLIVTFLSRMFGGG